MFSKSISFFSSVLLLALLSMGACTQAPSALPSAPVASASPTISPTTPTPQPQPPQKPAEFVTSNLTISPDTVDIFDEVTISVTVSNIGQLTGTYNVDMRIDDVLEDTKSLTLDGGASRKVAFTTSKSIAKTYSVSAGGLSGSFLVYAPPPRTSTPTPVFTATPKSTPTPTAANLSNPTWTKLQAFEQPLESGAALSPRALKDKAATAGINCGYAYITLSNGTDTKKIVMNVFQTTDYGLVCLESTPDGILVWDLGVANVEFRGTVFSQISPNKLHDTIYWQNPTFGGYHYPGYSVSSYSLSW